MYSLVVMSKLNGQAGYDDIKPVVVTSNIEAFVRAAANRACCMAVFKYFDFKTIHSPQTLTTLNRAIRAFLDPRLFREFARLSVTPLEQDPETPTVNMDKIHPDFNAMKQDLCEMAAAFQAATGISEQTLCISANTSYDERTYNYPFIHASWFASGIEAEGVQARSGDWALVKPGTSHFIAKGDSYHYILDPLATGQSRKTPFTRINIRIQPADTPLDRDLSLGLA